MFVPFFYPGFFRRGGRKRQQPPADFEIPINRWTIGAGIVYLVLSGCALGYLLIDKIQQMFSPSP